MAPGIVGEPERRGRSHLTVIHHVKASLFPNWVGTDQERFVVWDGARLLLSTAPTVLGGQQLTAHLVWERVGREQ